MRHESKLSFVKQYSIRGNFKNVCKTAIKRWLCYQLKYNSNLVSPNMELGPIKSDSNLFSETEHICEQILQLVPDLSITSTVYWPKWLQINSIVLKPDVFPFTHSRSGEWVNLEPCSKCMLLTCGRGPTGVRTGQKSSDLPLYRVDMSLREWLCWIFVKGASHSLGYSGVVMGVDAIHLHMCSTQCMLAAAATPPFE